LDVLNWTEEDRRVAFKGSPMKRAKLDMMRRNAAIVAKNSLAKTHDEALLAKLKEISKDIDEPEIVRSVLKLTQD
jgi:epoxyqueuosine reductase QueG